MSHLVVPKAESVETTENYGRFIIEPLEKGLSVTLGNVMRRILLGHLQGAAVVRVKIEGIQHEFTTIPNVKEDVIEFLLNIKEIRLKPLSGRPGKLILDVNRAGPVYARDIEPSADFEITNPDLYLATLDTPDARLNAELDIELGEGYQVAGSSANLPVGVIPVDAIFSPVRKVNFGVETVHTGQETSRERLTLEVWTDGTITPSEAVSRAAEILTEQLSAFTGYTRAAQQRDEKQTSELSVAPEIYNMPVEQLNLSVRTLNCLRRGGITTVGEIVTKGEKELMALRNFGQKSKQELAERLNELGISLAFENREDETQPENETSDQQG